MTPPVDIVALIADAVAARLENRVAGGGGTFKLVDRDGACEALGCSLDHFREQIEANVPTVVLPGKGTRREFRRWDMEDLRRFVDSCKRSAGEQIRRAG